MLENNSSMLSENASQYPEPAQGSSWMETTLMTAALIGGGVLAYKTGLMRHPMRMAIRTMGEYRHGRIKGTLKGVRQFANDQQFFEGPYAHTKNLLERNKMAFREMYKAIQENIARVDADKKQSKQAGYVTRMMPQMVKEINDRNLMYDKLAKRELSQKQQETFMNQIDDAIIRKNVQSDEARDRMKKRIGYRQATLRELQEHGNMDGLQTEILERAKNLFNEKHKQKHNGIDFMEKIADEHIFFDEVNKKIIDTRDFRTGIGDFMDSLADDFTIPFVKINPIRMFYLKSFSTENTPPRYHHFKSNQIHPTITGTEKYIDKEGKVQYRTKSIKNQKEQLEYAFIDGTVYGVDKEGTIKSQKDNMRLIEDQSPWGRLVSVMSGRMATKFEPKSDKWYDKFYFHMAKTFDVGLQDETVGGYGGFAPESAMGGRDSKAGPGFVWWDLTTYPGAISWKIHDTFKPYKELDPMKDIIPRHKRYIDEHDSTPNEGAEGEKIYTALSSYRSLKDVTLEDWRSQWTAGRANMQDASTIGMTVYAFFERLNATLGQAGMALGSAHLGSAAQVAGSLFTYRMLPVWAGIESLKWINYTGEQLLGEEPEDMAIEGYTNLQLTLASIRDSLGLTDFFKNLDTLTPGNHFLTEIALPVPTTEGITPIKFEDLMPLASSEEELAEYYESGEQEVRKGRFWEFGNTPFVGGQLDYWEPNWVRRLTSDYEYQENTFGSKDEYWENHALPSIQYPLAPIRHFITDPYHWELENYDTRPYPITGEIAELRDIPLVGPLLSKTIGEALKPTMFMHTEEWMQGGQAPDKAPLIYAEGQFGTQVYRDIPEGMVLGIPTVDGQVLSSPITALNYVQDVGEAPAGEPATDTLEPVLIQPVAPLPQQRFFAYGTPSGGLQIFRETQMRVEEVRSRVEGGEPITRMASQMEPLEPTFAPMIAQPDNMIREDSWEMNMRDTWYNIAELGGFYGFSLNTMIGHPVPDGPIIERASDLTSYSKGFWEQDIGNLGGDFNEIYRRFLPREQTMEEWNPIRNRMPEWLPGEDYYLDFQHGDPYTKVKKGEIRLPGDAYETLHNVDDRSDLAIDAYFLGRNPDEIMKYWLHQASEPGMKYEQRKIKTAMNQFEDVQIDADGTTYYNQELGIYGKSDFDVSEIGNETGMAPVIVREVSGEEFESLGDGVRDADWSVMNAMMDKYNPNSYVVYRNADTGENKITSVSFSSQRFREDMQALGETRAFMQEKLASGEITEGDFYDPVSKFRILSDVAPYSQEYRDFKEQLREVPLTDEQQEEVREIRQQLRDKKDSYRIITPYQYKTADLEKMQLTVSHILDNGMIVTEEMPDNPLRIAGVNIPRGKGEEAVRAREIISSYAQEGQVITVGVDANPNTRINKDTYDSMRAVIYEGPDNNLSETLMEEGFTENEEDFTAPGVHARFNWLERSFGSTWESFAHMNTPYHTKFMQARSALEQYERRDVYGKDWQDWANPIDDFLIPTYQSLIGTGSNAEVLLAGVGAGLLGVFFGGTPTGKIIGAVTGFSMVTAGRLYTETYEAVTGSEWIPERRREERELVEYMDALKYVKNQMLFDKYANESLEQDGFDVRNWIAEKEAQGEANSMEIKQLEEWRKILKIGDAERRSQVIRMLQDQYSVDITDSQAALDFIKSKLEELRQDRNVSELPELAATALMYYNESEKTMYGYDAGEPLANFIQALPRTDRAYFKHFMEAPEEEQERILAVVPDYMKPVLRTAYGDYDNSKKSLAEIFENNELPDASWEGWTEAVNLDDVKIRIAKQEQMDMASLNIFKGDEKRAANAEVRTPQFHHERQNPDELQSRIYELAKRWGIANPSVQVVPSNNGGYNVTANVVQNRQSDVLRELNSVGEDVFNSPY